MIPCLQLRPSSEGVHPESRGLASHHPGPSLPIPRDLCHGGQTTLHSISHPAGDLPPRGTKRSTRDPKRMSPIRLPWGTKSPFSGSVTILRAINPAICRTMIRWLAGDESRGWPARSPHWPSGSTPPGTARVCRCADPTRPVSGALWTWTLKTLRKMEIRVAGPTKRSASSTGDDLHDPAVCRGQNQALAVSPPACGIPEEVGGEGGQDAADTPRKAQAAATEAPGRPRVWRCATAIRQDRVSPSPGTRKGHPSGAIGS